MANNPKRPGAGASTSFRSDEIDAVCQLFDLLFRGGTPGVVMRSESIKSAYGKFKRMQIRLRERASEGEEA
jgi:hypothetical protein